MSRIKQFVNMHPFENPDFIFFSESSTVQKLRFTSKIPVPYYNCPCRNYVYRDIFVCAEESFTLNVFRIFMELVIYFVI